MAKLGQIVVTMGQDLVSLVFFCEQRVIFFLIVCILDTIGEVKGLGQCCRPLNLVLFMAKS